MNIPADLKYTTHDEWVKVEADGSLTVGITEFAQDQLGEIVYVDPAEIGESVTAGSKVCEIESVKAVADILAPCDGEILAFNDALDDTPESVNESPYDVWLYKLKPTGDLSALLDAAAYTEKIG